MGAAGVRGLTGRDRTDATGDGEAGGSTMTHSVANGGFIGGQPSSGVGHGPWLVYSPLLFAAAEDE